MTLNQQVENEIALSWAKPHMSVKFAAPGVCEDCDQRFDYSAWDELYCPRCYEERANEM